MFALVLQGVGRQLSIPRQQFNSGVLGRLWSIVLAIAWLRVRIRTGVGASVVLLAEPCGRLAVSVRPDPGAELGDPGPVGPVGLALPADVVGPGPDVLASDHNVGLLRPDVALVAVQGDRLIMDFDLGLRESAFDEVRHLRSAPFWRVVFEARLEDDQPEIGPAGSTLSG
jgi:hypothetical protein